MVTPSTPSVINNNIADETGGGLYFYSGNAFSVVANTIVDANQAVAGAGAYFRISNYGTTLQQVSFADNKASSTGAGLLLFAGQYGVTVKDCNFTSNTATVGGAGLTLTTGNGVGLLADGNDINVQGCAFQQNTGAAGGAVYLNNENVAILDNSVLQDNTASNGNGGAVYLNAGNTLTFASSVLSSNTASLCGGAASSEFNNSILVESTNMTGNAAQSGGALCILDSTLLALNGSCMFRANAARTIGGWMALSNAPLWNIQERGHVTVAGNTANRGSAAFLFNLRDSNSSMHDMLLSENKATVGGTVYWIYDDSIGSRRLASGAVPGEPAGLSAASVVWDDNVAPYGAQAGTQAVQLVGPLEYEVTVYSNPVDPPIEITMRDFYNQIMPLNGDTTVTVNIPNAEAGQCFNQYAHLSGNDLFGTGVPMQNGVASFSSLEAYCAPHGNVTVRFSCNPGNLAGTVSSSATASYAISLDVFLTFRGCYAGEINTEGVCQVCHNGTYSFEEDATECTSCTGIDGVSQCYGSEIVLDKGYWRSSSTSTAVMPCLLDSTSCVGGMAAGAESCAAGYEAALCSVCAEGYYLNNYVCESCSSGKVVSPVLVLLIVIVSVVVLGIGALLFYRYVYIREKDVNENGIESVDGSEASRPSVTVNGVEVPLTYWQLTFLWIKMKYNEIIVKVKIIVSTVQVVSATSLVFDVSMPRSFSGFMHTFDILQLSFASMFPLNCTQRFNFMDTLLLTTLFPLGAAGLLIFIFMGEYTYQDAKIQANPHRKRGEKMAMFNLVKNKYLNYLFFLSYLVLPAVTSTIFQIFICTDIDPYNERTSGDKYYLTADTSISCDSDYYHSWLGYAYFMIVVYPVGVPAIYLWLLYLCRQEIMDRDNPVPEGEPAPTDAAIGKGTSNSNDPDSDLPPERASTAEAQDKALLSPETERLAFLWSAYKPQYWFWEVVETNRRIMLTAVLSICAPGTSEQNVLSLLLGLMYIKIYGYFSPYVDPLAGVLAETGQFQIFFTFFGAMVIQNHLLSTSWNNFLGAILILINLIIIGVTFYSEVMNYLEESKLSREEQEEKLRRATAPRGTNRATIVGTLRFDSSNATLDQTGESNATSMPVDAASNRPAKHRRMSALELHAMLAFQQASSKYAQQHPTTPSAAVASTAGTSDGRRTKNSVGFGAEVEMSALGASATTSGGSAGGTGTVGSGIRESEDYYPRHSDIAADVYDEESLGMQHNPLRK